MWNGGALAAGRRHRAAGGELGRIDGVDRDLEGVDGRCGRRGRQGDFGEPSVQVEDGQVGDYAGACKLKNSSRRTPAATALTATRGDSGHRVE